MRKDTRESIDKKISEIKSILLKDDNEILKIYQKFHNANSAIESREEISEIYVKEIDLIDAIERIKNANPFSDSEIVCREQYSFGCRGQEEWKTEKITKETLIQRNLFINRKYYENELGLLVGYEVVVPRKKRDIPIDLIGAKIDGDTLTIKLIELKACSLPSKIEAESKELLLRAIFEILTYNSWVKSAKAKDKGKFIETIIQEGFKKKGKDIKDDKVKIENIVLVPEVIAKDVKFLKDKRLMQDIKIYTLKANSSLTTETITESEGKYFDIVRYL